MTAAMTMIRVRLSQSQGKKFEFHDADVVLIPFAHSSLRCDRSLSISKSDQSESEGDSSVPLSVVPGTNTSVLATRYLNYL